MSGQVLCLLIVFFLVKQDKQGNIMEINIPTNPETIDKIPLDKTGEVFDNERQKPSHCYSGIENVRYKIFTCADCNKTIHSTDIPSFLKFQDKIKICIECADARYKPKEHNPNAIFQSTLNPDVQGDDETNNRDRFRAKGKKKYIDLNEGKSEAEND